MRAPFFFLFIIWSNKYCNGKCTILSTRCSSLKIIRTQNRAIILETSYSKRKVEEAETHRRKTRSDRYVSDRTLFGSSPRESCNYHVPCVKSCR